MNDRIENPTPRHIVDACEASLRDIAEGNVFDARDVLAESQRALDAYRLAHPTAAVTRRGKPAKSSRAA